MVAFFKHITKGYFKIIKKCIEMSLLFVLGCNLLFELT